MQTYFVMIVEADYPELLKVKADNEEQAQIVAMARFNGVERDEIDLDCLGDISLYVVEERLMEDYVNVY